MKGSDIVLLNHQREFVESTEKEVIMLGGMATGKTFAQAIDCWQTAIKRPGIKQAHITGRAVTGMENMCCIMHNEDFKIGLMHTAEGNMMSIKDINFRRFYEKRRKSS